METVVLSVGGMTCQHCVRAVEEAVRRIGGVALVRVDLASGRVEIEGDGLDTGLLLAAVREEGYEAVIAA